MSEQGSLAFAARLGDQSEEQIARIDNAWVKKIARRVAKEEKDPGGEPASDFGNFGMGPP